MNELFGDDLYFALVQHAWLYHGKFIAACSEDDVPGTQYLFHATYDNDKNLIA
jgi:hypothetical protein